MEVAGKQDYAVAEDIVKVRSRLINSRKLILFRFFVILLRLGAVVRRAE